MLTVLRTACVLISLLAGNPFAIANPGDATATHVDLTDARPTPERGTKNMSLSVFSCNFGILQFGEKDVPNRVSLLSEDLNFVVGSDAAIKHIQLVRYDIYYNNSHAARNGVYVDQAMNPMRNVGNDCPREKNEGGLVWTG